MQNKSIRNIQTKMNKSRRLSHDEIYNTLQLAYHLDNFVHQFSIFPDWRKIATLLPNINRASTVLVTDRGKAVVNAIKKVVPNAALVHCWNHIHSDANIGLNNTVVKATINWYISAT